MDCCIYYLSIIITNSMNDFVENARDKYLKTITDCYCVCHSDYSSCAYCNHCKGDNEVMRYHARKREQK